MENNYRKIQDLRTTELFVKRSGFWCPDHILIDGQFEYGRLMRPKLFRCERIIETADGDFKLQRKGFWGREIEIFKNEEKVGSLARNTWDNKQTLQLHTGFNATFARTAGSGIFSRKKSWSSNEHGELLTIKSVFSFSKPFIINIINTNTNKNQVPFLLMALLGVNTILRQQEQAAAATSA